MSRYSVRISLIDEETKNENGTFVVRSAPTGLIGDMSITYAIDNAVETFKELLMRSALEGAK